MIRRMYFVLALAASLLLLAACSSGPKKISVKTTDFVFDPMTWTVSAGEQVELTIKNDGKLVHEWAIIKEGMEVTLPFNDDDEEKVIWELEVEPGETKTETFTAPSEPGSYTVVCGTVGHLEQGMAGTLIVK